MLRNKELERLTAVLLLITAAATIAGFFIDPAAAVLALVLAASFGTVFFIFTRARYRSIAHISYEIDQVLHNAEHLYISESEEGELSILQSEITKMTLRIREQNDALKREKKHLADSLADIAHQLRTPLTSANIILSLLANSSDETERKSLVRETEELFIHMDRLLTSLLKLSRLDAGIVVFQKEQVHTDSLIKTSLRPFLIPMELHNISLHMTLPQGITIEGDADWLSEAIQNILKNCIEGTGDNGSIEIACEDNPIFTQITIRDRGPGFKEEELPFLFDRFYRGTGSGTAGYGIGLALCRTIITRQGGSITAKNHPQGGALFSIRFPK